MMISPSPSTSTLITYTQTTNSKLNAKEKGIEEGVS